MSTTAENFNHPKPIDKMVIENETNNQKCIDVGKLKSNEET